MPQSEPLPRNPFNTVWKVEAILGSSSFLISRWEKGQKRHSLLNHLYKSAAEAEAAALEANLTEL